MSTGPEFTQVERPFLDQLVRMGWKHTTGNLDHPGATGRESFRDVLITTDLRQALRRINLDPQGNPWLDDGRITQAINALQRLGVAKLLEANQAATELILKGTVVDGVEGWDQGRGRTVHFIDWDDPDPLKNNVFRAVNQFKLACPSGHADKNIIPDIVLFVNGIPLVVVEAKSPRLATPLEEAVNQLQRYANRRRELGVVDVDEGNEQLFHYTQFLVATCGKQARVGTFSSLAVHYVPWKDTSPVPMAQVAAELTKKEKSLTQQETLVAGMLRPAHLLDIVHHFTLVMEAGGRRVKAVGRYQQFRAVQFAAQRMLTGKTRKQDGEYDRRGGIIWHTQGSGKSLTMVFLIRKMRSHPDLRRFKVVVVTDRHDLEKQLSDTAALTEEKLTRVKSERRGTKVVSARDVLQEILRRPGKDLVFAMIQKYRGELIGPEETNEDGDDLEDEAKKAPAKTKPLPVLNTAEDILVLVDEAHRSHTNTAHANLMRALPNCVKIGFTGTPIIMRAKGQTAKIFGDFIDRYTIRESEADKSTVPILYEGRTTGSAVDGGGKLDEVFEDMLVDRSPEELELIKQKYATKGHVMEAEKLIAAKARNMLRHYVENILPNGFKAQVVAVSRRAAVRYYDAFRAARDELVAELEAVHPNLLDLGEEAISKLKPEKAFLLRAHRYLPTLKALEFAPVISAEHNDAVDPDRKWSTRETSDARIARFKLPLFADGPNTFNHEKADPLAFLLVKSMLLTGFDAPIEQVMYLDRNMKEAELLQAIARVNRTYAYGGVEKGFGIVVDYYGVALHLKEALAAYSAEDIEGALQSLKDEIPKLRDRHRRTVDVFTTRDIDDIADTEACVELLRDEKLRAEFHVKLKQFLDSLDLVMPRPEALPFVNDAKTLAYIQGEARNRYRSEERLIGEEVGEKVRRLIDDHIISLGITPKIAPVELTADDFEERVDRHRSSRAKASEMEHALRYHIRRHFDEDPTRYEKLSERLKNILKEFEGLLAVKAAQERVAKREGGVIWHTQGSGKSILMVLLAKWLLEHDAYARILVITDRDELDKQIEGVMKNAGVISADSPSPQITSRAEFVNKLGAATPRLLCALIHKFDVTDLKGDPPPVAGRFYVFVDECHRTQGGNMNKQMKRWLSAAIFIGFTGTPLLRKDKQMTRDVFGTYIHTYKFHQAVADKVVLDLKYEARDVPQRLTSQAAIDKWFEQKTKGLNNFQKAVLRKRWATMEELTSAGERKQRIIANIIEDFSLKPRLNNDRGTAILVAASIYDACHYYRLFQNTTFGPFCGLITSYEPNHNAISREPPHSDERYKFDTYTKFVLPKGQTTKQYEDETKRRFIEEPANMKLLIVVSKLLTGFDAPSCTYIYLDNELRDHNLFQAICRTNRLDGDDKDYGHIVDFKELFGDVQQAIAVYSSDELDIDEGTGGEDNIHLKNWLEEGRKRLDESREALRYLCEPVPLPRELEQYLRYFCGDAADPNALTDTEALRVAFYKAVAVFVRAFAAIAQGLAAAGYSESEITALQQEVQFFTDVRAASKKHSGEELDIKPFEADMRHLINTYIQADTAQDLGELGEMSLTELIIETGIHDAIARKLNEKGKLSRRSIAEGIINNVRKTIIRDQLTDPKFYERMSQLLDDLIKQSRDDAAAYEEFLRKAEDLAKQLAAKQPQAGVPAALHGRREALVLFNNLDSVAATTFVCPSDPDERAELALQIDRAIREGAPAGWKGDRAREAQVQNALFPLLGRDREATMAVFEIVKNQPGY